MIYSLNQIEHTVRKAARGAGLAWGLAEEAGRAIRWLEMVELDGVNAIAALLEQFDHQRWPEIKIQVEGDHWRGSNGLLSPLVAGPSLCDVVADSQNNTATQLTLEQVPMSIIILGYAGIAAAQSGHSLKIGLNKYQILVDKVGYQANLRLASTALIEPADIQIESGRADLADAVVSVKAKSGARQVDQKSWQILETFAHKTYVEATEASRLAGAGAGVTDND